MVPGGPTSGDPRATSVSGHAVMGALRHQLLHKLVTWSVCSLNSLAMSLRRQSTVDKSPGPRKSAVACSGWVTCYILTVTPYWYFSRNLEAGASGATAHLVSSKFPLHPSQLGYLNLTSSSPAPPRKLRRSHLFPCIATHCRLQASRYFISVSHAPIY